MPTLVVRHPRSACVVAKEICARFYSFVSGAFGRSILDIFVACGLLLGAFFFALFLRVILLFFALFFFRAFPSRFIIFLAFFSLKPDPSG